MRALAEVLLDLGWHVTGSDIAPASDTCDALLRRGVRICIGHGAQHVPRDATVVVYSPAVPADNPERAQARARGVPEVSYPRMLGRLMREHVGVSITGTHGKSTTTAMLGWVLEGAAACAEPPPSRGTMLPAAVVCGAELIGVGLSGWAHPGRAPQGGTRPSPPHFGIRRAVARSAEEGDCDNSPFRRELIVAESCEYRRHFLELCPRHAVILGIEPDHFDCYPDIAAAVSAYAEFAARLPAAGVLVCRGDCAATRQAVAATRARVVTFAVDSEADWSAHAVSVRPGSVLFEVRRRGTAAGEIELRVPGRHHAANALAVTAIACELGVDFDTVKDRVRTFPGLRRRFERVGTWRGVTLVSDYAHHPTAVAATLRTARDEFGRGRVWCIFQPHQVSRTRALLDAFPGSLADADEVMVVPVYAARERAGEGTEEGALAEELARSVNVRREPPDVWGRRATRARFVESLDHVIATLETEARPGDVVLAVGAGDVDRVVHDLARAVSRHHTP
jgi:UDP-N-acetylmuramate--alanine ligase